MTVLFRSFVVWLMLLALPYQGYASAQMQLCAVPATGAAAAMNMVMPDGPHDHAAMLAAHKSDKANPHTNMKCSGSACCAAAAPLLTLAIPAPLLPSVAVVPFYSDFLPAVDLAHPERPPQGAHA